MTFYVAAFCQGNAQKGLHHDHDCQKAYKCVVDVAYTVESIVYMYGVEPMGLGFTYSNHTYYAHTHSRSESEIDYISFATNAGSDSLQYNSFCMSEPNSEYEIGDVSIDGFEIQRIYYFFNFVIA